MTPRITIAVCAALFVSGQAFAETPIRAFDFVDSIGVNVQSHATSPTAERFDDVVRAIEASRIRNIRTVIKNETEAGRAVRMRDRVLADTGVNLRFLLTLYGTDTTDVNNFTSDDVHPEKILTWGLHTADLIGFEGTNELNGFSGPGWQTNVSNAQRLLWNSVKNNPQLAGVPVVGPSLSTNNATEAAVDSTKLGSMTAYMDYGNAHDYTSGNKPSANQVWMPSNLAPMNWPKKVFLTETGYFNHPSSGGASITEEQAGIYYTRMFFERYKQGFVKTFAYVLSDDEDYANESLGHWGLMRTNGTSKPALTSIANTIAILDDPGGAAFVPKDFIVNLSGGDANTHSMLLQKENGRWYLAVWSELNWWDTITPQSLTLTLSSAMDVVMYSPYDSMNPVTGYANVTSVQFTNTDRATIIEIIPTVPEPMLLGMLGLAWVMVSWRGSRGTN